MRQRAFIGALLLVLVGIVLGATVFRSDIAQATGLAQAVTVQNTPLPVREQNLDTNGNLKVHEQGTAIVSVASLKPVTDGGNARTVPASADPVEIGSTVTASAFAIHMSAGVSEVRLVGSGGMPADIGGPAAGGSADVALALTRPIQFDRVYCFSVTSSGDVCNVSWVGASP
jgi:hypothetical protein